MPISFNKTNMLTGFPVVAALCMSGIASAAEVSSIVAINSSASGGVIDVTISMADDLKGAGVSASTLGNQLTLEIDGLKKSEVIYSNLHPMIEKVSILEGKMVFDLKESYEGHPKINGQQITLSLDKNEVKDNFRDALSTAPDVVIVNPLGQTEADGILKDRPLSDLKRPKGNLFNVKSIDFDNTETVSTVYIQVSGIRDFSQKVSGDGSILVDIPNASVPKHLIGNRRAIDTTSFYSPVKRIVAYKVSEGARVRIEMKEVVQHTARLENGFIRIDIPIPEYMQDEMSDAMQSASSISPAEPDEGIRNAYQKEILIGEQGRTVDPQAAFGNGAGSDNPASMLSMSTGFMIDNSSATSSGFSGEKISLDFVSADIHNIFRIISHVSKLNIVTGDDVKGQVTVRLENVPWDQALAAVLQAKGLGSQRFGNIIRVAPIDTIKTEQVAALEAKRAQEELTELKLMAIPLNYVQATELQGQIKELISSRGSLQVDTRGNQLIIKETEDRLAQIRELIRHLDKPTPQVLIEARVVEASSSFSKMLGIQWGAELHANASTGYPTGLFFPNSIGIGGGVSSSDGAETFYNPSSTIGENMMVDLGADAATSGLSFSLGSIPGLINLDARLSAMESDGWGKVVSEPRITTMDNQMAKISQGARVPYLSTSSGGTQVQFVEAALEMEVTPHITSDNSIFLSLKVSNNRPDFSQLVQGQPAISIKEASTSVLVADGDTTVIGGVFSSETSYSQDKVPGFHKIPLLGYLFKNSSDTLTRNELLVFITPHIVTRSAQSAQSSK